MTTASGTAVLPQQATGGHDQAGRVTEIAAGVTIALVAGWDAIRIRHPEVPEVVMSMATGGRESSVELAHFSARRWRSRDGSRSHHEVFVTAESLERGAADVFESLLHEAAHALNEVRGEEDGASQYHNRKFAKTAAELGLDLATDVDPKRKKKYGFTDTVLPEQTRARYADQISLLDAAISATRTPTVYRSRGTGSGKAGSAGGGIDLGDLPGLNGAGEEPGAEGPPPKEDRNYARAVCGCKPPTVIRVSPRTLARRHIMCALCTTVFTQSK